MKKISITISLVAFATCISLLSCGGSSSDKRIERGYTSDPSYTPTFDNKGEYHNNGTGDKQIQYQGSAEQQRDLDAIDEYMRTHPDF